MNAKEVRKRLDRLGVSVPRHKQLHHIKGDTYLIIADKEYAETAAKVLRRNGYFASIWSTDYEWFTVLTINLAGTEWQDGLIPENLEGLPLREDDKQLPLL